MGRCTLSFSREELALHPAQQNLVWPCAEVKASSQHSRVSVRINSGQTGVIWSREIMILIICIGNVYLVSFTFSH